MFYHIYDPRISKGDFIEQVNELITQRDLEWNLKQYLRILHSPKKKDDFVTIRGFLETVVLSKLSVSSCYINKLTIKDKSEIRNEKIKLLIK